MPIPQNLPAGRFPREAVHAIRLSELLISPRTNKFAKRIEDRVAPKVRDFSLYYLYTYDAETLDEHHVLENNDLSILARVARMLKINDYWQGKVVPGDGWTTDDDKDLKPSFDRLAAIIAEVLYEPKESEKTWAKAVHERFVDQTYTPKAPAKPAAPPPKEPEPETLIKPGPEPEPETPIIEEPPAPPATTNGSGRALSRAFDLRPTPPISEPKPPPPTPTPSKKQCRPEEILPLLKLALVISWKTEGYLGKQMEREFTDHQPTSKRGKVALTVGEIQADDNWRSRGLNPFMIWVINRIMRGLKFNFTPSGVPKQELWSSGDEAALQERLEQVEGLIAEIAKSERGEPAELGKLLNERLALIRIEVPKVAPKPPEAKPKPPPSPIQTRPDNPRPATTPTPAPSPKLPPTSTPPIAKVPAPTPTQTNQDHSFRKVGEIVMMPIELIEPMPGQPRTEFDEDDLQALAKDIKTNGLQIPISVMPVETKNGRRYQLLGGERRWRASKKAGLSEIKAIIRYEPLTEDQAFEEAVADNANRKDLSPLDKSDSIARLKKMGRKPDQIAIRMGCTVRQVKLYEKLDVLHEDLRPLMRDGKLAYKTAITITNSFPKEPENQWLCWKAVEHHEGRFQTSAASRFIADHQRGFRGVATPTIRKKTPDDEWRTLLRTMTNIKDHAKMLAGNNREHWAWLFEHRKDRRADMAQKAEEIANMFTQIALALKSR